MRIAEARDLAAEWVLSEGVSIPGFAGAFHHGSSNWAAPDDELSPSSDLDIMVVLDQADPPVKPGKFDYRGLLLEVSLLSSSALRSPEVVLGTYHLAGNIARTTIIADPTGNLTRLQAAVADDYARRDWVRTRCEAVVANIHRFAASHNESGPVHDQFTSWLFATGGLAHLVLVAGLANPTVRRRYAAARELLDAYHMLEAYEPLLAPLGCAEMTAQRVERYVAHLELAFDAASAAVTSPFFFATDLSQLSRPIAIDGSRELIAQGLHREAIFWIGATYGRCLKVLHTDAAPGASATHDATFAELLTDLGVPTYAERRARLDALEAAIAATQEVANAIIAASREVHD